MDGVAPNPSPRRGGRRARRSRELILQAALELADANGIEALSMRAIGERLGVEAMSLYRHVENKDDVLDGLIDIVYDEIEVPLDAPDWRAAMRHRAISAREVLRRHPWAIALMESRTKPGPANLRHHDAVVGILLGAGFSSPTSTHAYNLLDSYIYGFALQERSLPFASPEKLAEFGEALLSSIPADVYPHLSRSASELIAAGFDYGAEFGVGLDIVLDGIARAFGMPANARSDPSPRD